VTHTLSLTFFPRWIRSLQQEIGTTSLKLFSYDGEHCRRTLAQGDCHFMVCHYTPRMAEDFRASRLRSIVVGHDRLVPVTVGVERQAAPVTLPGNEAAPVPYLTYTPGSYMGRSLELFLQAQERPLYLQPCFETSLAQGMKAMVVEGHGVGWLPEAIIRQELDSGALIRAGDDSWDVRVEVRIFRAATRLSRVAERLWSLLALSKPPITEFL
jgi:DNA-binding transcriptional LysR family regulator